MKKALMLNVGLRNMNYPKQLLPVVAAILFVGCGHSSPTAAAPFSVAELQAFHAELSDAIYGGELPVRCSINGLPDIWYTGRRSVDSSDSNHAKLLPISWTFVKDEATFFGRPAEDLLPYHLLTIQLVPASAPQPKKVLCQWRHYRVEILSDQVVTEEQFRLRELRDKLIHELKSRLTQKGQHKPGA